MLVIFCALILLVPSNSSAMVEEKNITPTLSFLLEKLTTKEIEIFHELLTNIKDNSEDIFKKVKDQPALCLGVRANSQITPFDTLIKAAATEKPYWDTIGHYLVVAKKIIKINLRNNIRYPSKTSNARRLSEIVTTHFKKDAERAYLFYKLIEDVAGHEETKSSVFKMLMGEVETMIEFLKNYPLWLDVTDENNNTLLLCLIKNGGLSLYEKLFKFLITKRPLHLFLENNSGSYPLHELSTQEKKDYNNAYELLHEALLRVTIEKPITEQFFALLCKKKYKIVEGLLKEYPQLCFAKNHNNKDASMLINTSNSIISTKNNERDALKKTIGLIMPTKQNEVIIENINDNQIDKSKGFFRFSFLPQKNKKNKTNDQKNFNKTLEKKNTQFSTSFDNPIDQSYKKIELKTNNSFGGKAIPDCGETVEDDGSGTDE